MEPIEAVQAQHLGEIMINFKNSKIILSVLGLAFWFCSPALAQRQAWQGVAQRFERNRRVLQGLWMHHLQSQGGGPG
jgi:hypothetical protein